MICRYNFLKYSFKPFENWKLRMGTYGGVRVNHSMPFSVPVSTSLSSSAECLQLQLALSPTRRCTKCINLCDNNSLSTRKLAITCIS